MVFIRWAIVWQDTILSIGYDRPSGILAIKARLPSISDPNGHYKFTDIVHRICNMRLDFCREKLFAEENEPMNPARMAQMIQMMEEISHNLQPHLVSTTNCFTVLHHVEHYAAAIYINHASAHFLQSTLEKDLNSSIQDDDQRQIFEAIVSKSEAIVEAFIRMRQVSILSTHSWSLLHAVVSAAKFVASRLRLNKGSKSSSLVQTLIASLKTCCEENINVVNGFTISLSQTVLELTAMLEN